MPVTPHPFIDQPPSGLAGWVQACPIDSVPVLARTVADIHAWVEKIDDIDAHTMAGTLGDDPLMTLKVHVFLAQHVLRETDTRPDTLVGALLMIGIGRFFRQFTNLPQAEDTLRDHPVAWQGFQRALRQSRLALAFASGLGGQRGDFDVAVLREAAALHAFAEMVAWTRAPALMTRLMKWRGPKAGDAEDEVFERAALGISLAELRLGLMQAWQLQPKLVGLVNGLPGLDGLQVRIVQLSVRAARIGDNVEDPRMLPVAREVADMFQMGEGPSLNLLRNSLE